MTLSKYAALALILGTMSTARATDGNASVSASVYGSPLVISTSNQYAGAISSLTWNGMQFINAADHGREFQSASSFDGLGECYNPTEAGSLADTTSSTSVLLGINASGNVLATTSQMAFWTPVGYPYPQGCDGNTAITVAQNTTNLSNDQFSKLVSIGYAGIQNVIQYLVTFRVPEAHQSVIFESVTGYMPTNFSWFLTYDPQSTALVHIDSTAPSQEDPIPLIFSTADRNYAIGIYSPDLPQAQFPNNGYGHFDFTSVGTEKWNLVFRESPVAAGAYNFQDYLVVGNLDEVITGMRALGQYFYPTSPTNQVPVHRFHLSKSGDYFFTLKQAEGLSAGYTPEGIGFHVFASNSGIANTIPLYRCLEQTSGLHFVSQVANCEGATSEGMYGYVYASATSGSVPLYKFYLASNGAYLTTTNYNEGINNGYTLEGILGYVP